MKHIMKFEDFNFQELEGENLFPYIKDIFIDEIVDVWDIEEITPEFSLAPNEDYHGIFYDFYISLNEFTSEKKLRDNPILFILINSGLDHFSKFEKMQDSIDRFKNRCKSLGYNCTTEESIKEYIRDISDEYDARPFEIKIFEK